MLLGRSFMKKTIYALTIDLSATGQTVQVSIDGVLSLAEVIGTF